jgi:hypothetical protein
MEVKAMIYLFDIPNVRPPFAGDPILLKEFLRFLGASETQKPWRPSSRPLTPSSLTLTYPRIRTHCLLLTYINGTKRQEIRRRSRNHQYLVLDSFKELSPRLIGRHNPG